MAIELALNRMHFVPLFVVFPILFGSMYTAFAWFWFEVTGIFYYFFLDYDKPFAIFWHLGLLTALSVFFFGGLLVSNWIQTENPFAFVSLFVATFSVMKIKSPSASVSDIKTKHN